MNLQQLRCVVEIARQGNHLSAAAAALNTSQPGVSRQIKLLEEELGFEVFERTRNRIVGLTAPGREVLEIARRMNVEFDGLRRLKDEVRTKDSGTLVVATTHTQARYVLPRVIKSFVERYPAVQLNLKQGDPEQVCQMVEEGSADLAIGPQTVRHFPQLIRLPCLELTRCVVGPPDHPIFSLPTMTLGDIAAFPIIAYDPRYTGRWKVMAAFEKAGLKPRVAMSAIDADVCKTYAALGMGLAILASVTYDAEQDRGLVARDAGHLFATSISTIAIRPSGYVRPFVLDFIAATAAHLTPQHVREAMRAANDGADSRPTADQSTA